MCQQYSGHTVKLTYIVFRNPLMKSSYWQNVSVPDYKKLQYLRIYRALLLPGSDSTDGESARFSRYEKNFLTRHYPNNHPDGSCFAGYQNASIIAGGCRMHTGYHGRCATTGLCQVYASRAPLTTRHSRVQPALVPCGGALYASEQAGNPSSGRSLLIDLTTGTPSKVNNTDMLYSRIFHNEVVLPNGEVMAIGGNAGEKFSDNASQMTPEIWNPTSRTWRPVADISVPRNYHSVALLMKDGRVWSGGGGLCDCAADHLDSQVYSPAYLFNADGTPAVRPEIVSAPSIVSYGTTANVTATDGIARFTMVRMSSTTHALNSDMRFLNIPFSTTGTDQYSLNLHNNPDVMTPGYWMLFALDNNGVPSVAKIVSVSTSNAPVINNPGDQSTLISSNVSLNLIASDPNGDAITFNAVGLPQGLSLNENTGLISGVVLNSGSSRVVVSVSDGINTASTSFVWNIVTEEAPVASPVFGDINGTPFADTVQENQHLVGVNVRHGWWLDAIQSVSNTGDLPQHGGTGGTIANIIWPADEYLVRIYGTYGAHVGKVSFVTNTGRVFGPYGIAEVGNDANPFDYTVPVGREIVGFTGRTDDYLIAVGVLHRVHQIPNQPPVITSLANQVSSPSAPLFFAKAEMGSNPISAAKNDVASLPSAACVRPATAQNTKHRLPPCFVF